MLDIKFIADNKQIVADAIKNKKTDPVDLDRVLELHAQKKELSGKISENNQARNEAAKNRDIEKGRQLKEEGQKLETEHDAVEKEFVQLMIKIPNVPSPDTPIGPDESGNKVVMQIGDLPDIKDAKPHWELGKELGILDTEKAADVSGSRFAYIKGDMAMLQYALLDLSIKLLTDKDKLQEVADRAGLSITVTPFVPIVPPLMVRSAVMNRMARLDPIDDRYFFEKDDLVFVGSAEHSLGPIHMDETFKEEDLPVRYFAYTPAFRREAGTYGKDTRGIVRLHHFDKVEMETFVRPEDGYAEQDFMVALQEHFLQILELPYQKVAICTGDMGAPDQRQIDLETWMPGQGVYKETHTADYMGGYQARRLNTRVKRADGKTEAVHMNDATFTSMNRPLAAILENYQQEDGTIRVPKVLQHYIGKDVIGK